MRWGQLLPTGEKFCCHTIQEHRPIKANMAVHSGEPLCHPATARIAMGAHPRSTPAMASQQPIATEPLQRHQAMQEQGNHPRLGTSGEQLGSRPVADPADHDHHQARQLM